MAQLSGCGGLLLVPVSLGVALTQGFAIALLLSATAAPQNTPWAKRGALHPLFLPPLCQADLVHPEDTWWVADGWDWGQWVAGWVNWGPNLLTWSPPEVPAPKQRQPLPAPCLLVGGGLLPDGLRPEDPEMFYLPNRCNPPRPVPRVAAAGDGGVMGMGGWSQTPG